MNPMVHGAPYYSCGMFYVYILKSLKNEKLSNQPRLLKEGQLTEFIFLIDMRDSEIRV